MLLDSSTFLAPESNFSQLRVQTVTTLPVSGMTDGDFVYLTQADGSNPSGLYWYNVNIWEGFTKSNLVAKSGGVLTGLLTLSGAPTNDLHAATKKYVDDNTNTKLSLEGGTLLGALTLNADPSASLQPATKQYVDAATTNKLPLAGGTMLGALTLNADPTSNLHAATKQYVDSIASGLDPKASCRVATTGNISLSGLQNIDGVTVDTNDRILVWKQNTGTQNGIYAASSGAWTRTADATTNTLTSGTMTFVEEGTANGDVAYVLTTNGPIVVGTSSLTFVPFAPLTTYAGTGLSQSGNTLSADFASMAGSLAGTGLSASGTTLTVPKSYIPYDVAGYNSGKPGDAATISMYVVPTGRSFTLPAGLTNSIAKSLVAPTSGVTYTFKKNGTAFATLVFNASSNTGAFTAASQTSFSAGDYLTVHSPATSDATHADIMWTLVPSLVS